MLLKSTSSFTWTQTLPWPSNLRRRAYTGHWITSWLSVSSTVRTNTDWNRPPWPGPTATICMSYVMTGDLGKEHRTNKPSPTGRIQERSKEIPRVLPPPIILLARLYLGWEIHVPPGRTLSQKDCPETTQKLIPSPKNTRLWATWQGRRPGFPYPAAFCQAPLPNKVSWVVSTCVS